MGTNGARGFFSDIYGRDGGHLGDSTTNPIVSGLRRANHQLHNARRRYYGTSCSKANFFYDILNTINSLDGEFKNIENISIPSFNWKNVQSCHKRSEEEYSNNNITFLNEATNTLLGLINSIKEDININSEKKKNCQKVCDAANKVVALENKLYELLKRVEHFKVKLLKHTPCLSGYGVNSNNKCIVEPCRWLDNNIQNSGTRRSNSFSRTRCHSCNIPVAENKMNIKCVHMERDLRNRFVKQTHSLQLNNPHSHKNKRDEGNNTITLCAYDTNEPNWEYNDLRNKYNNRCIPDYERKHEVLEKRRVIFQQIGNYINKPEYAHNYNESYNATLQKVRNRAGKDTSRGLRPPPNTIFIRRVANKNNEESDKGKGTNKKKRNRRRPNTSRLSSEPMLNENNKPRKTQNKGVKMRKVIRPKSKYKNAKEDNTRGSKYVRVAPSKFSVNSSNKSYHGKTRKPRKEYIKDIPSDSSVGSSPSYKNNNSNNIQKKMAPRTDRPSSTRKQMKYVRQRSNPERSRYYYKGKRIVNKKPNNILKKNNLIDLINLKNSNILIDSPKCIQLHPCDELDNYYELIPSYKQEDISPKTDACRCIGEEDYKNQLYPIRKYEYCPPPPSKRCKHSEPNVSCCNRNCDRHVQSQEYESEEYFPRGCSYSQNTHCPNKSVDKQLFKKYVLVETPPPVTTKTRQQRVKNERFIVEIEKPSIQYAYSGPESQEPKLFMMRKKRLYKKKRKNIYKDQFESKYIITEDSSTTQPEDSYVEDNVDRYSSRSRTRSTSKIVKRSKGLSSVTLKEQDESSSLSTSSSTSNFEDDEHLDIEKSHTYSGRKTQRHERKTSVKKSVSKITSSSTSSVEDNVSLNIKESHSYRGSRTKRHESKTGVKRSASKVTSYKNKHYDKIPNTLQNKSSRKYRRSHRKSRESTIQYTSSSPSEETITEPPEIATKRTSTTELRPLIKTIGTNTLNVVVEERPKTVFSRKTSMSELTIPTKAMATNTFTITTKDSGVDPIPEKKIPPFEKTNQFTITDKTRVRSFGTDAVPEKPKLKMINTATDPLYHLIQVSKDTNTVPEAEKDMHDTGTDPKPIPKIDQTSVGNDPVYVRQEVKETNTATLITAHAETETLPKAEGISEGTDPERIVTKQRHTSYDKVKTFNRANDPIANIRFEKGQQFDTVKKNPKMISVFTRTDDKTTDCKITQTSFLKETPKKIPTTEVNTQTSKESPVRKCSSILRRKTKVIEEPLETPSESSCLSVHLLFEKWQEEIYRRRSQICKSNCLNDISKSNKPFIICEKKKFNTIRIRNDECIAQENTNNTSQPVNLEISIDTNDFSQSRERVISENEINPGYLNKYSRNKRLGKTRLSKDCGMNVCKIQSTQNFHISRKDTYNDKMYVARNRVEGEREDSRNVTSRTCDWIDIAKKVKEDHIKS